MKIILSVVLSLLLTVNSFADTCNNTYKDIVNLVEPLGWVVTATTNGRHNAGSKHPKGKAVDVSVRLKNEFDVVSLTELLLSKGYGVRDERIRPLLQRRWSGPHLHLFIIPCVEDEQPKTK